MPDGGTTPYRSPFTGGYTASFTVQNTGSVDDWYLVWCGASGPVTCTGVTQPGVSQTDVFVPVGGQVEVLAYYDVGTEGTGTLVLDASSYGAGLGAVEDGGTYTVPVGSPPPPPPPPPVVVVTPDGEPAQISPATGLTNWFSVYNPRSTSRTFNFTLTCSGVVSCGAAPGARAIGPGETAQVAVTHSVSGGLGTTGVLKLYAVDQAESTNKDSGWVNVSVAPSGPVVERALCLTIAAGPGAAYECGDLRLVHAFPGVRTFNTQRAPTLLYNSQHAHPYPLFQADVTVPTGPLPDSVRATLVINSQTLTRSWLGTAWGSGGQTRRVVIGYDAAAVATGLYDYQLTITKFSGGSGTTLQTVTGSMPIVNRSGSAFGPGWWLAGYEKLYFNVPSGQALWVGGDGSVRRYERTGTHGADTVYLATPVDHPDTLLHTSTNQWIRLLSGGSTVTFTANGTHRRTTNRLGYRTEFYPDSLTDWKLLKIQLPPDTTLTYDFGYGGTPAKLTTVSVRDSTVGVNRVTALNYVGDSLRVIELSGRPDSTVVVFQYQAGGTNRIIARRSRRRVLTTFTYDAGYRLASSRLDVPGAESIISSFCAADVRGLASCSPTLPLPDSAYTRFDGPRTDSADVQDFWADRFGSPWKIRDPYGYLTTVTRADARWPALATRLQHPNSWIEAASYDARGNLATSTDSSITAVTRYAWDQRWDRVTEIRPPTGQFTRFGYDATNGNRLWQEDGRGSASRVTFEYYASGNGSGLLKIMAAPGGARDSLGYDARGNLAVTRTPLGWLTYFDNDRVGRTALVRTQIAGGQWRHDSTYYDQLSRVTRSVAYGPPLSGTPAQSVIVRNFYNAEAQLDSLQRSTVPDNDSVGTITTRWRYDVAGRRVAEVASDWFVDSTRYDPAGNATTVVTRRGHQIGMIYDRLNRLRRRIVPDVTYPKRDSMGIASIRLQGGYLKPYPWYPTDSVVDPWTGTGHLIEANLLVPGETAMFAYDEMGRMTQAENGDAKVWRSYYPNGLLHIDSLRIRVLSGSDFQKHRYGIEHRYDAAGRRVVLKHPRQLAPRIGGAVADSVRYVYDPTTALLDSVYDPLGSAFRFIYNDRNEPVRVNLSGGIEQYRGFDLDGRLVADTIKNFSGSVFKHPDATLRRTRLHYADAFRLDTAANALGWGDTVTTQYSGLGQAVGFQYRLPTRSNWNNAGRLFSAERFNQDGMGNVYSMYDTTNLKSSNSTRNLINGRSATFGPVGDGPPTGRLRGMFTAMRGDSVVYDSAGNTVFKFTALYTDGALLEDWASWYSADGKLRFTEYRRVQSSSSNPDPEAWPWNLTWEEYRYDPLGRRVLVRTRRNCHYGYTDRPCALGTVRRTVWDGTEELYEIQMRGSTGSYDAADSVAENDTLPLIDPPCEALHCGVYYDPNPRYGRVAYTHGPGLDQPLSVVRINYVDDPWNKPDSVWGAFAIVPHWNWRGQADYGTYHDGGVWRCSDATMARCVSLAWRYKSFAFTEQAADTAVGWHGTLLDLKEDGTGTLYRRNRYVDPVTGRFTQEDPIGLVGGMNLYGFAKGDPVNFSDPFGLCAKGLINLGLGYCGRVDAFGEEYEIHVFRGEKEIGIFGRDGWINRHGFRGTPGVPRDVLNRINGENVAQLRARGLLAPRGEQNIRGGRYSSGVSTLFGSVALGATILGAYLDIREAKELEMNPWAYMTLRMQGWSYEDIRQWLTRNRI